MGSTVFLHLDQSPHIRDRVEGNDAIVDGIGLARERFDGFIGVYPETGDFQAPEWDFEKSIAPDALVDHARDWVKAGARLIGGCCGTNPDHIHALSDALPELEATIRV